MVKQKPFVIKHDRLIDGCKFVNDIMLSSLLIANAERGNYPAGQKQFYEKLRAVVNGEKKKKARNLSQAAAINRRMRRSKQFEALKLMEAFKIINEKHEKLGQS